MSQNGWIDALLLSELPDGRPARVTRRATTPVAAYDVRVNDGTIQIRDRD